MRADLLIAELSLLTYSGRQKRMVQIGQLADGDATVRATLAEMERGGVTERCLALQSCFGTRDGSAVLKSLTDPSRRVRGLALTLVAEICTDEQAVQAISMIPGVTAQRSLLRRLSHRRRWRVVDAWLGRMTAEGDRLAGTLLSYGSPVFVERQLEEAAKNGISNTNWYRLAQFHPDAVLAVLQRRAEAARHRDEYLVSVARMVLPELSQRRPLAAEQLVKALNRHVSLSDLPLQNLIERRPGPMADLVLRSQDAVHGDFSKRANQLSGALLVSLAMSRPQLLPLSDRWIKRLSSALRSQLVPHLKRQRDVNGCLPAWLMERLPADDRIREARQQWRHLPLAGRPLDRIACACCLPWDEARSELTPFIQNPDATLRAAAIAALVRCLRFERDHVHEVLEFALARKNEQDPVRSAMITALADLPIPVWQAGHLAALGQIIRQALDAADLSSTTSNAAQTLVVRLLPSHSDWALTWLATLVKERGQVDMWGLEHRLTDADVQRLAPALLPVLRAWDTRERQRQLVHAAMSLGRRLRIFPEFVAILEGLARNATGWVASMSLLTIQQQDPRRFGPLVPQLLEQDPSWITQPVVHNYLHRQRQDLLDPYLGRQAYKGRFGTGKTRFVLPFDSGFWRWWPSQRAEFAQTLIEVTRDKARDNPALIHVVRQLGALVDTATAADRLIELAAADNKVLVTRDSALRALGRLDSGEGIKTLLEAMDDDRGRIAIYALRSALLEQSASQALKLLRGVPSQKVTVAKEVVRLIGDLRTPQAYAELLVWNGRELHRDIRVALLRAFWEFLNIDSTWPVLEQAAVNSDPAIAAIVTRIPADGLSSLNQQRLAALVARLLVHPEPEVRIGALLRCYSLPVSDEQRVLQAPLLASLKSAIPDEVRHAAVALFATYAGRDPASIEPVLQVLLSVPRSLDTTLQALQARLESDRERLRPTADIALSVLSQHPLCLTWRVRLAVSSLRGIELADYLAQLALGWHVDAFAAAIRGIETSQVSTAILEFELGDDQSTPTGEWLQVESRLASAANEQLRRLALAALVRQARESPGWTLALRTRLVNYCHDPSPLVAGAAAFVFPPPVPDSFV